MWGNAQLMCLWFSWNYYWNLNQMEFQPFESILVFYFNNIHWYECLIAALNAAECYNERINKE